MMLIYTKHSKKRMFERGIKKKILKKLLIFQSIVSEEEKKLKLIKKLIIKC